MSTENQKLKLQNHSAGFTLTEVIIASALLIIAIVPILKALTAAHLNSILIERKTASLILAQAELNDIKARSIYGYSSSFSKSDVSLDGLYLCDVSDSGSGSDLRTITVSVGYDLDGNSNLDNSEVKITLSTYLANRWL